MPEKLRNNPLLKTKQSHDHSDNGGKHWKLLILFLFMLGYCMTGKGQNNDLTGDKIDIQNFLNVGGYIYVKIPIHNSDGQDEWVEPDSYISLNNNRVLEIDSDRDTDVQSGLYYVYSTLVGQKTSYVEVNSHNNIWYEIPSGTKYSTMQKEAGSVTYAEYKIYPTAEVLKSGEITVNVKLQIGKVGVAPHDAINNGICSFTMPTAPTLSVGAGNPGKMKVSFTGAVGDKYRITDRDEKPINGTTIEEEYDVSNDSRSISLTYYKKVSEYQFVDVSSSIIIPAYQFPSSLTAEMNADGNVDLKWSIPTLTHNNLADNDKFEVQRSDNVDFSNPISVGSVDFDKNKGKYQLTDKTSESNLNGIYYYRLRRTAYAIWDWKYNRQVSIELEMQHKYINSAEARMIDNSKVQVNWEYDSGNVWSNSSDVILVRTNEMKATNETYAIPKDSLMKRSFTETLLTTCDVYSYKIYVKPGNSNYSQQEALKVDSDEQLFTVEMGEIISLDTSKGYYADQIELDWTTDGKPVDVFSIRAREYGSSDEFKQIDQVGGNVASTNYQYSDKKAIPGIVYEYQIAAISSCGGENRVKESGMVIGFRTPTGNIYGRVTYENGQAVKGVEVRAEISEGSGIKGKSYTFDSGGELTVTNHALLKENTDSVTLQAWVNTTGDGIIVKKEGMYELYVSDSKPTFKVGSQTIAASKELPDYQLSSTYIHLSGVTTADSVFIYVNGKKEGKALRTATVTGNNNPVTIGGGFEGSIDEVRIWGKSLDEETIVQDYTRYLTGNETKLLAYYTFDYSVDNNFYDISYTDAKYNKNHGTASGAVSGTDIPTISQLSYKGITATDGSYTILGIPYTGNGTTYMIIPRLGIHKFESEKELRLINANSQSHTVNFIDKSSFVVSGKVTYKGGTIPVEGVSFKIDGITAMDGKANVIRTDAKGMFSINVPVGTHEVRAEKLNHVFTNEGKITNSDGTDRNYQDLVTGIELKDSTTIRYIGRVAGGVVQENYPIGHSLSKNNLGDGIKVTLTYENGAYKLADRDSTVTMEHFKSSNRETVNTNNVNFNENQITIYPNPVTGEFVADVLPEKYKVTVSAPGHDTNPLPGNASELNLTNSFLLETSLYEYIDSVSVQGEYIECSDTVYYNKAQLFIKRYTPVIHVAQLDNMNKEVPYFGEKSIAINALAQENSYNASLYDEATGAYTLGLPVFEQGKMMKFGIKVYEEYIYKNESGNNKADVEPDKVPTQDARITFGNELPANTPEELVVDSLGYVEYSFQVGNPELTSAKRLVSAKMTYGDSDSPTSVDWAGKFDAIILGVRMQGTNFITGGPDEIIFVLRDPPGSNSYAYLEKGISRSKTSTYTGKVVNSGSEVSNTKIGTKTITFAGIGAGTIVENDFHNELGLGVKHEESVGGVNSTQQVTTTTTRFQTSADPAYVGAGGDIYVGYSTNISFGKTDNINIVSREVYNRNPGDYEVYENITPIIPIPPLTPEDFPWLLVQTTGIGVSQKFGTLFVYPQVHIEEVLLPQMESFRNNILHQHTENIDFQALANEQKSPVYVSHLTPKDENYGKSNSDRNAFGEKADNADIYDGPSYKIYFPAGSIMKNDTILALNQSMDNWVRHMKENEADKVNADLLQNYSFQAGSSIEYSESYSHSSTATTNFSIAIGLEVAASVGVVLNASTGFILDINEDITTEQGGEFTTEEEANHSKGFVLEDNDTDYLSVDVCRPKGFLEDDQYIEYEDMKNGEPKLSTFIFKTKGGATSCPHEAGYITKYYEPGQVIDEPTVQIEVPEISVENDFIENVPSGKPAYITLYIRNNSESQDDNWYNLKVVDESNPFGAGLVIDAAPIGNGRALLVRAGETLVKTLEVRKGTAMNYDDLKLTLESQCQCDPTDFVADIVDTVAFTVHFIPSATEVNLKKPANNWTYNTKLPTEDINGIRKHYLDVVLDGFDVNYDNFYRIMLQYKPSSGSDDDWSTLMSYYNDAGYYDQAVTNGMNAEMIKAEDAGAIKYKWFLDDLQDQRYDLRAVGTSLINNVEIENISEVHGGIKDMYNPRLFGSAQPANGILSIMDEIRLNFNETIAEGYLTDNNFQVTGIRNGSQTDHSVSVRLDGENDRLTTEFERNWANKDLTIEMWVLADKQQNAVFFSQGNVNEALELGITADNHLKVRVGTREITSQDAVPYEQGTWAHVALVLDKTGYVSAYYNFVEYINHMETGTYSGEGMYVFGAGINGGGNFAGKMHNARIWDKVLTSGRIQTNSMNLLSGAESNLLAYYPMNEAKGSVLQDKARGANLEMNGSEWALPEGRAVTFNGIDQYLRLSTGSSAVVDYSMDYTIEFWFKGEPGQNNATLVANGRGDGQEFGSSRDLIFIGFESGVLTFYNNEVKVTVDGDYLNNDWHHLALAISRTTGRGQILIDGTLKSYFESQDLGGVSAAYMYLGARGWTPKEMVTTNVDNFFKGEIDDFRMWNLYKNETLVANGNSERLDGTEKGLLAYYPFEHYIEWQGTKELQFTLKDMKAQIDPTQAVPDAEAFGGNVETGMTAPVKDKGPVSKLLYDFVVNNDALIITMNETWDRIEKTIVTFTVDGVRDINGNEILNPITWSAYIDRNQLKWSESEVTIEKPVYEEKEFKVKAVNKGGSVQYFTIENMPAWLTVNPESGTIAPSSSLDITFTIDEGLNIGSYDEMIYMRNDNNVVEALPVKIIVKGEKPDWTVNPADYKYNMSVIGKLRINNIFSSDKEDMLAAFQNGKCIGVANCSYDKTQDMWYAFLTVYNNTKQSDGLEFRIWDASTGKIYSAMPDENISFKNDVIYGGDDPVIFDGKEMFFRNIALATGWNWISFNLASQHLSDVNTTLMNGEWTSSDIVKSENDFDSYSMNKQKWTGTLSNNGGLNNHDLFMINSSKEQVLSISGTAVNAKETPITVKGNKWNYISYVPNENFTVKEALAGYDVRKGDIIKSQNQFAVYSGNGWIGNLTYMEANKGYMLLRNADGDVTFTYPTTKGSLSNTQLKGRTRSLTDEVAYINNAYAENMSIIAIGNGIEEGDRILAYIDGELRGISESVMVNETDMKFISVTGSGSDKVVKFEQERNGKVIARSSTIAVYKTNSIQGTLDKPFVLNFMGEDSNSFVYPNPFVTNLNICVNTDEESEVGITIYDILGRIILKQNTKANGLYHEIWNGRTASGEECTSGIYLIHVLVNGKETVHKVEKK